MRTTIIAPDEYYHIFNRSNDKHPIFHDTKDWARFLFLIIYLQSSLNFNIISRQTSHFVKNRAFNISGEEYEEIVTKREVGLINFTMMPNHFHLTLREVKEGGIATYMQRVLCAFTKYYNAKYNKSGHLFQGPYKAVHVEDNDQLLYLSTYIHRNQRELPEWKNKEKDYPWSSLQDYVKNNRWEALLEKKVILDQFNDPAEYQKFVSTSTAKKLKGQIDEGLKID